MAITDSNLWKRYVENVTEHLRRVDPSISDAEIAQEMKKIAQGVTVPITIHETTHDDIIPDKRMTLYQTIDELESSNDIISAAGVVVARHEEDLSPFVNMFINWKKERGAIKKKMYQAADRGDADMERYYNKLQLNLKSNKMNAMYGILALVSSAFFHEFVPDAVTSSGRQLISHSALLFESVLGNNHKFLSMAECINWIDTVCEIHKNDKVDSWVTVPTYEVVYERLVNSFWKWTGDECDYLKQYVNTLSHQELVYVYYTNNLVYFIRSHPTMFKLLAQIYDALPKDLNIGEPDEKLWTKYGEGKELNSSNWRKMIGKRLFLDPYHPPAEIQEPLKKFREYIWQYCYTPFLQMSAVSRLNKQTRKAVAVIDTDSNMIYTEQFTSLCSDVCNGLSLGVWTDKTVSILSMMIIANVVDPIVVNMIATFFKAKRVSPEYYPNMVMKNEWYYALMLISKVKKRYAGHAMIQEGLILPKVKPDIKGFDFKKAAIPKKVQDILINILVDRILTAPGEIDVMGIVDDINKLEADIRDSIRAGDTEYWKISTYKDKSAYRYPERIQVYVGGTLWNQLYPEDQFAPLDKACVAKLKKNAMIRGVPCGNVIAVPMKIKKVPEEIISQLDVDLMAYNITSSFNSVLECFNIDTEKVKTSSGANILRRKGTIEF